MNSLIGKLEYAIDSGNLKEIKSVLGMPMASFVEAYLAQNFDEALRNAFQVVRQSLVLEERIFGLQSLVGTYEVMGDFESRRKLMIVWNQIGDWPNSNYARIINAYQQGMTCFFDGRLLEAEKALRASLKLSKEIEYSRGILRATFSLALVFRDRHRISEALSLLNEAAAMAKSANAKKVEARIADQIRNLTDNPTEITFGSPLADEIKNALLQRQFQWARKRFTQAFKENLSKGVFREAHSLYSLYPVLLRGLGKHKSAEIVKTFVLDPVIRMNVLKLEAFLFKADQSTEIKLLEESIGIEDFQIGEDGLSKVNGIVINQIPSLEVQKLLQTLSQTNIILEKSQLVETIFQIEYDPVIHDPKLYKLLHRARQLTGVKDLFENTYGGYRLNQKYFLQST